ncbi:pyridoxamine 5'-phosphate oxidase family protein ustO [Physcia stellaris]|nr:pyridoxamine 5'-phosphate oxidase family protein ustO [Physcia stellaris]
MVQYFDSIPDNLRDWDEWLIVVEQALEQQVFFTASAPLAGKHVNISPKGLPASTFTIFDPNHAAYVDATGSGAETISHVYENGRVTIMFCSFAISPRIMRFFCTGKVVEWDEAAFLPLLQRMGKEKIDGARAVILLDVFKQTKMVHGEVMRVQVQSSCGFGVPYLSTTTLPTSTSCSADGDGALGKPILKDRETMGHWASKQIEKGALEDYQAHWNADSLDGLTGLRAARRKNGERLWVTDLRARYRRVMGQREARWWGFVEGLVTMLVLVAVYEFGLSIGRR